MENLLLSFNIILPIFICIALGYLLRRIRLVNDQAVSMLNKLTFKVFLPIYLFNNIYSTDLSGAFNLKLILFSISGIIVLFGILMLIVPRIEKENPKRGVMIQGIFRSNFALFGLPLALSLVGEEKIGATSLLVAVAVPIYNILAVVTLESFRGGKPDFLKILKGIATNPLIIASLLGLLLYFTGLKLPSPVQKAASDLGKVATPLSLVALGGSFVFRRVGQNRRQLIITVAGRLILAPLIFTAAGAAFGFRNEFLVPILIMFGAPTAVSSFPMAEQMGGDAELAAQTVVISSAFSILTFFIWIFLFKQIGWI